MKVEYSNISKESAVKSYHKLKETKPEQYFSKIKKNDLNLLVTIAKQVELDEWVDICINNKFEQAIKLTASEMERLKGGADPGYDLGHAMGAWIRRVFSGGKADDLQGMA